MNNVQVIMRELINEMLTPEEERAWHTHMATLPKSELAEGREHFEASHAIHLALIRLMDQGAEPGSDEVQRLLQRSNETSLKYRFRERLVSRERWNSAVARKVYVLGHRIVTKTSARNSGRSESEVIAFCAAARHASKWGQALDKLMDEARVLAARHEGPESPSVQKLARRFAEICERNSLGDPVVYARWFMEFEKAHQGDAWARSHEDDRAGWTLLIDAVTVASWTVN